MLARRFHKGQQVIVRGIVNPAFDGIEVSTGIRFRVRYPDGTVVVYTEADDEVTNPVANIWYLTLPPATQAGDTDVYVLATSGVEGAAGQGSFEVLASNVAA